MNVKDKKTKPSFKSKNHISTSRPLEFLHIDPLGLVAKKKRYALAIIDDYTRFT